MSELKKWLLKNNLFNKSEDTQIPSHLLYDGGKIYVPRSREHEFLEKYSQELEKGSKLYYVETRPNTFKYMIDIDITDDHYWSLDEITHLVKFIQNIVYDFFDKNNVTICAISSEKTKSDGIHTGIHLIWPKIVVNSQTALIIRRGIVQKLNTDFGPCTKNKTWEDTIDECIYTRNGYRMVGSDKIIIKKDNDGKIIDKIPENRELKVVFVMNSEGELKEEYLKRLKDDYFALSLETSIRYVLEIYRKKDSKGMELKKLPKWLDDDALEIAENKNGKKNMSSTIVGNKELLIIENIIHTKLPKDYCKKGIVKAVTRYEDGNILVKTNSRFCMNIGKNHNSCGIYFLIVPNGLYQKCLCTCDNLKGRKKGYCHDYTSEIYKFSDDIRDILFPEYSKTLFLEDKKKQNKYIPGMTENKFIEKKQKDSCDKLFNEILSM